MERKLYDQLADSPDGRHFGGRGYGRSVYYAGTNRNEYFAEVSCAYLDRLLYPPTNRDELKDYDSAGHKLMEKLWGKPRKIKPPSEPRPDADKLP